jgi:N-acetylneuraminic acid mutarotase
VCAAAVGGTLFIIGGFDPGGGNRPVESTYADSGVTEAYDPVADTWQLDLAPMPTPRDHAAAAEFGGRVHVFGGRSPALGFTASTHEVYDPSTNSWTTAAALPTGRGGIGAAVLNGRIHVFGGEADHTFDQNEAYDPLGDTWLTFAPMPTPRHSLGVVAVGDAIYVIGGGRQPGDSRSNVVEVFR